MRLGKSGPELELSCYQLAQCKKHIALMLYGRICRLRPVERINYNRYYFRIILPRRNLVDCHDLRRCVFSALPGG